jgi:hypothetical protein
MWPSSRRNAARLLPAPGRVTPDPLPPSAACAVTMLCSAKALRQHHADEPDGCGGTVQIFDSESRSRVWAPCTCWCHAPSGSTLDEVPQP